ncbi:MAG: hypothetical protein JJT94_07925 [Bernardetiaceae bacterium]|nr:hypothetical protein [Bernardetiaceae bacterium]
MHKKQHLISLKRKLIMNKQDKNPIDAFFENELKSHTVAPSREAWKKLERRLENKKKKPKRIVLSAFSTAAAVVMAMLMFGKEADNKYPTTTTTSIAQNEVKTMPNAMLNEVIVAAKPIQKTSNKANDMDHNAILNLPKANSSTNLTKEKILIASTVQKQEAQPSSRALPAPAQQANWKMLTVEMPRHLPNFEPSVIDTKEQIYYAKKEQVKEEKNQNNTEITVKVYLHANHFAEKQEPLFAQHNTGEVFTQLWNLKSGRKVDFKTFFR